MATHAYTPTSEAAKAVGTELLEVSRIYHDPLLPHGYGAERMSIVASVVRARRLLSAAYALADRGDGLEAGLLTRAVFETALMLGWLKADRELGLLIWMFDDQRSNLSQHEEVRRAERNRRRRARRARDVVPPLDPGRTLGLLDRSSLARHRRTVAELEAKIRALPRLRQRLRKLRPLTAPNDDKPIKTTHINRLPGYSEQARVAGLGETFAVIYPFESRAAVHPYPLGLEQFLESRTAGVIVHSEPQTARPDPYAVGAASFALVLELASGQLADFDLQPETARLVARLGAVQMHS